MDPYPAFTFEGNPWIAPCDISNDISVCDYNEVLFSLSDFIEYHTQYVLVFSTRHCEGETPDVEVLALGAMTKIEKTIQLFPHSLKIISHDFIDIMQRWLSEGRLNWRIIIPATSDSTNWVTIYATLFRVGEHINPSDQELEILRRKMRQEIPEMK